MSSDIFDTIAIEAAAQAITKTRKQCDTLTNDDAARHLAKSALNAAETSLRERGMMRDGRGVATTIGEVEFSWSAMDGDDKFDKIDDDFPVAIIRLPKDTA
jgi:hypothetical protein